MIDQPQIEPSSPTSMQQRACREDWLRDSVLSGFAGTFAMSVVLAIAYGIALAAGVRDGNTVQHWFWALAHNPVTRATEGAVFAAIALNLVMGIVWAVIYGRFVEPRLSGPGWRRGMIFSLIPWILSIVAFLPVMGGGFLGFGIGAGPLPLIGNLILHLVYGAVLGAVFAIALEAGLEDATGEQDAAAAAERGAAVGVGAGIVIGALGAWALGPNQVGVGSLGAAILAGALVGAAIGVLLGSLLGMARPPRPVAVRR